jgi:hypothetical protein
MWKGKWDADKKAFTGVYTFPDGGMFDGVASLCDVHRVELKVGDGYSKVSEHPCEPYWDFTGTWRSKDGAGYAPHMPPPPTEKDAKSAP